MQSLMKAPVPPQNGELVGYARVSTADQKLDLQLDALKAAGVHPDRIHKDFASGARVTRKGLVSALRDAREGDTLVVWKLDRLGRSVFDLLKKLEDLDRRGVGFRSLTESIDTTTAMGKLVLHMVAAMAQFERDLTRERTSAGMRAAKDRGQAMGAKRKLDDRKKAEAEKLLRTSRLSVKEIAERLKVSTGTIYNAFPGGRSGLFK
jgi:DNA invertase Pin-like site-specific DNA recombinase